MSCIMKYRKRDSNDEWQYYEEGNKKHCIDFLIMNEFDVDYEYEIYEFSKSGVIHGVSSESLDNFIQDYGE